MNYLQLIDLGKQNHEESLSATLHFDKGMMVSLEDKYHIIEDTLDSLSKRKQEIRGKLIWNAIDILSLSESELQDLKSKKIDFFTLESMLLPDLTVLENLELAASLGDKKDASLALKKFDLEVLAQCFPEVLDEFSKFKIALIMGIIRGVELIIFGSNLLERFDENPYEMLRYCVDFFNVAIIVLNPSKNDLGYYDSVYINDNNLLKLKYSKRIELMKEDMNAWKLKETNFDL